MSYLFKIMLLASLFMLGCQKEAWRQPGPRVVFERFFKHLSKLENLEALEYVDPEDREKIEEIYAQTPPSYKLKSREIILVGSLESPRMLKRIEVPELSKSEPKSGERLKLILHFMNDKTKEANLVWRHPQNSKGQWFVDFYL